MLDNLIQYIKM